MPNIVAFNYMNQEMKDLYTKLASYFMDEDDYDSIHALEDECISYQWLVVCDTVAHLRPSMLSDEPPGLAVFESLAILNNSLANVLESVAQLIGENTHVEHLRLLVIHLSEMNALAKTMLSYARTGLILERELYKEV